MRGILQKDLSAELPKIRAPRDATIPSVWDQELIVRLLGAVDRDTMLLLPVELDPIREALGAR